MATTAPEAPAGARGDVGLRVIIAYKAGKAIAQAALAAALVALGSAGGGALDRRLEAFAVGLAARVEHGWTAALARLLASLLVPGHLHLVALALGLDAGLSAFEGWALHRRFGWARWVVIAAAAVLIPFELVEIARAARPARVAALAVNLAIVAYLARRHRAGPPPAAP